MSEQDDGRAPDLDRGRIGMWLFLSTEALLFGGLFLLYAVYRWKFSQPFHEASLELSRVFGTVNTVVLITSSLTAALSIHWLRENRIARARRLLAATIGLGFCFLAVKAFEWGTKFEHGLYPGSAVLAARGPGQTLYFGLYFTMTGLHALHVIVGMSVFGWVLALMAKGMVGAGKPIKLENAGLFWHLVDIVWIFLFPLFYLIS
jgi:cytochrome c oxidase subunit 3